ncbi:restriction endonuclease subunit S [Dethiothermospora halolimnae]|uniref:restriction endonuclease subunit S n=1 Tax=Dethiothermospora halolimnae TaxID=3114390 RepID=UPI003CCC2C21
MVKNNILPYNTLSNREWTVDSLNFTLKVNDTNRIPLAEYASINKLKVSKLTFNEDREYPYIEVKAINPETKMLEDVEYIKPNEFPTRAKLVATKGDILLSKVRPDRGAIAIVPDKYDKYIVTNAIAVLTPKNISPELLYFIISHPTVIEELGLMASGSAIPNLSLKKLKDYKLPLNSIDNDKENQAKELYEKWSKRNIKNKTLGEITDTIFNEEMVKAHSPEDRKDDNYLTIPYNKLGNRLDTKYYFSLNNKNTQWKVPTQKLGDLVAFKNTINEPIKNQYFTETIPYIRTQDLEEDTLFIKDNHLEKLKCKEATDTIAKERFLQHKDIVIPRHGGNIRKTNMIPKTLEGAIVNQHLFTIQTKEKLLPEYLTLYLKTKYAQQQINLKLTGTVQTIIKMDSIKNIDIPVPSLEKQREIVDKILKIKEELSLENIKDKVDRFVMDLCHL